MKKKNYPVIDVKSTGKTGWIDGARVLFFVYSKYNGNFILRGHIREVKEYLEKNYTHYFHYNSMWHDGRSRGYWCFWKKHIGIFEINRSFFRQTKKNNKNYEVRSYSSVENHRELVLEFKRMPNRWIPEFDEF